jgi:hypothetical protein
MPGPKFAQGPLAQGQLVGQGRKGAQKFVEIDIQAVYGLPELSLARRRLELEDDSGLIRLEDYFVFAAVPLEIEEAFLTWFSTVVDGATAMITGENNKLLLTIIEPVGAAFTAQLLTEECHLNQREGTLTRISVRLPVGAQCFIAQITPA